MYSNEKEILLPANTSFEIVRKIQFNNRMEMYEAIVVDQGLPIKRSGIITIPSSNPYTDYIHKYEDTVINNPSWTPGLKKLKIQYITELKTIHHEKQKFKKIYKKIMKAYISSFNLPDHLDVGIKIDTNPTLSILDTNEFFPF